ncbi:immunoglobulin-binding protein 1 [Anopheles cruzii]|uniref:immunoglobulin-binding protein 1 n=1 Tax=Anopheles cruzii TaxID=68878 RepID=UPI0022EC6DD7|nr:immunoglobulin-binding protein 1 [Anopheles cruzii]
MVEEQTEIPLDRKLSEIFAEGYKFIRDSAAGNVSGAISETQLEVKKTMRIFEDATRLVSLVGMFSSNESLEEIPTENLRYLLLPFYLGQLAKRLCNEDRKEVVQVADVYFNDFLNRCASYGLYNKPDKDTDSLTLAVESAAIVPGAMSDKLRELNRMGFERQEKIRRYQQKKELEEQVEALRLLVEVSDAVVDDERTREFYVKLLRSSVIEAQEELVFLEREKEMIKHCDALPKRNPLEGETSGHDRPPRKKFPSKPLKPIIITRDAVQKAVYGRGYPSLPTMTVAEFYEQRVADGIFPDPEKMKEVNKNSLMNRVFQDNAAELDREEEEKETLVENDDEEYLARQRAKDEFKDEHRRGEGNRHNRS